MSSVIIPDSVISIGSAFNNTAVYNNPDNWSDNVLYINNHLIKADSSISGSYNIREGTICIADRAFDGCKKMTSIIIPYSVKSIGYMAFNACSGMIGVMIPDNVVILGAAFTDCVGLTDVVIGNGISCIEPYTFSDCKELKNVVIGNGVRTIGHRAFQNCSNLQSITVGENVETIASHCFADCSVIRRKVQISDIASWCSISFGSYDANPLYYSKGLYIDNELVTSLVIPNTVLNIGNYAFYGCENLTNLVIPDSVTSIGEGAFENCKDLKSVTIPENVTHICDDSFDLSQKLTIKCYEGSYADKYAKENQINVLYICRGACVFTNYVSDKNGTCTEDGTMTAYCDNGCGNTDTIIEENSKIHDYILGITSDPTCSKEGKGLYRCSLCKDYYVVSLPTVDHKFTDYVYNDDATCIKDGTQTAYCIYGCGTTDTIVAVGSSVNGKHNYSETIVEEATCISEGMMLYSCECGDFYTEGIPLADHSGDWVTVSELSCTTDHIRKRVCAICNDVETETVAYATGHSWSEWFVAKNPSTTAEGEQLRYCKVCKISETEKLPMIEEEEKLVPELSVNNYTIMLDKAELLSHIRYASGVYETSGEIKNAPDCVDLSTSVIAKNTANGVFSYEMPDGGVYSFWIKLTDGTSYILKADLTVMEQEVDAYGVTVTVKNLYGVKDYFIARGECVTYADVKANSVVQITQNKIRGAHNYKYILSQPGTYTVCVRYNDSTRTHKFITFEAIVSEPVFTENGLQLTVGNLNDIKVIRSAYGQYATPGDVKRADGSRAFTAKTVLKGLDEYTIQYRENGTVTVAVVYNNGYEVMYTYEVVKKVPNFISSGKTVIIGDLDGLNLVRYAEGKYTSSNQIKNATGSKVIKADSAVGGYIIVELDPGIYTFCVQYNDESYNYYIVVVK